MIIIIKILFIFFCFNLSYGNHFYEYVVKDGNSTLIKINDNGNFYNKFKINDLKKKDIINISFFDKDNEILDKKIFEKSYSLEINAEDFDKIFVKKDTKIVLTDYLNKFRNIEVKYPYIYDYDQRNFSIHIKDQKVFKNFKLNGNSFIKSIVNNRYTNWGFNIIYDDFSYDVSVNNNINLNAEKDIYELIIFFSRDNFLNVSTFNLNYYFTSSEYIIADLNHLFNTYVPVNTKYIHFDTDIEIKDRNNTFTSNIPKLNSEKGQSNVIYLFYIILILILIYVYLNYSSNIILFLILLIFFIDYIYTRQLYNFIFSCIFILSLYLMCKLREKPSRK